MDMVKVFCPGCGQKLGVDTTDLRETFRCPRCQAVHVAADLVSPQMTIMPVRVATPPPRTPPPPPAAGPPPHISPPPQAMPSPPPLPSVLIAVPPPPPLDAWAAGPIETGRDVLRDTAKMPAAVHPIQPPPLPRATPPAIPQRAPSPAQVRLPAAMPAAALESDDLAALQPDSGRLLAARQGIVRAVEVGRSGMVVASATLARILDLADRYDALLYGKRGVAIAGAALLVVVVGPLLDDLLESAVVTGPLTVLFGLFLATLALARIASFRDEDGRWSWTLVRRRTQTTIVEGWNFTQDFLNAPRTRKLMEGGRLAGSIGVIALALRHLLQLLFVERGHYPRDSFLPTIDTILQMGWIAFAGGLLAWWTGRRELVGAGRGDQHIVEGEAVASVEQAARALPTIIDLDDQSVRQRLSAASVHPLLSEFLEALYEWQPRRYAYEDQYQVSLFRHLRRVMPDAEPERERPIASEDGGQRGRIDLLLGRCLLVEMKRRLDTSSAQRALGQLTMYSQMWKDRGPIVLLLCGGDAELRGSFLAHGLEQLRLQGVPIIAVVAGTGRRSPPRPRR